MCWVFLDLQNSWIFKENKIFILLDVCVPICVYFRLLEIAFVVFFWLIYLTEHHKGEEMENVIQNQYSLVSKGFSCILVASFRFLGLSSRL